MKTLLIIDSSLGQARGHLATLMLVLRQKKQD